MTGDAGDIASCKDTGMRFRLERIVHGDKTAIVEPQFGLLAQPGAAPANVPEDLIERDTRAVFTVTAPSSTTPTTLWLV